jgi:hypothetical protein
LAAVKKSGSIMVGSFRCHFTVELGIAKVYLADVWIRVWIFRFDSVRYWLSNTDPQSHPSPGRTGSSQVFGNGRQYFTTVKHAPSVNNS